MTHPFPSKIRRLEGEGGNGKPDPSAILSFSDFKRKLASWSSSVGPAFNESEINVKCSG